MLVLMLLKKYAARQWKVLLLNIAVVAVLGTIAITIPHLIDQEPAAADAQPSPVILACRLLTVDNTITDYPYYWQIYQHQDEQVVTTWEDIYQAYCQNQTVLTVSEGLKITAQGLIYTKPLTGDKIIGWACYQGNQVVVRF